MVGRSQGKNTDDRRWAIVTGSGRHIGKAIAMALAADGVNVVVNVRASLDQGKAVVAEIQGLGVDSFLEPADVSNSASVEAMSKRVLDRLGRIDILVNNVGIAPMMPLEQATDEHWRLVLDVGLSSAFYCARAFIPGMRANGWGRVINLGGQAGLRGTKYKVATVSAKAGLIGFTRAIANEFAEYGVTCNYLAPGRVDGSHAVKYYDDLADQVDPGARERWESRIPAKRLATTDDVAQAARFLVSDGAGYINGQTLPINGGLLFV